jgi:site-specific recombinase XerD
MSRSLSPSPVLRGIAELRSITRAHVIAWRKDLEKRELTADSIRRKLSAFSALFDYLCEHTPCPAIRSRQSHPETLVAVTRERDSRVSVPFRHLIFKEAAF